MTDISITQSNPFVPVSIPPHCLPTTLFAAADLAANAAVMVSRAGDFSQVAGHIGDLDDDWRWSGGGGNECEQSEAARAIEKALKKAYTLAQQGTLAQFERRLIRMLTIGDEERFTLHTPHIHRKACQFVTGPLTREASSWEMEVAA